MGLPSESMDVYQENQYLTNRTYPKVEERCAKCGKKLTFFIAYIPSIGKACMNWYVEIAKEDEANTRP